MREFDTKPALLTRAEIDWLSGNSRNLSKSYEYKMMSVIRSKLKTLTNLEFPLIQKSGLFENDLTIFGKNLTTYGKVENSINPLDFQFQSQNMVGRKGFEPSNPAMSRRYLNQARPPALFQLNYTNIARTYSWCNFILAISKS